MTRGFTQVPNGIVLGEVYDKSRRSLSLNARWLYVLILHYSRGGDSTCTASQRILAHHLGVTDRTVRKWLDELVSIGLVEVRRRRNRTSELTPRLLPERKLASGQERLHASDKEDAQGEEDNSSAQEAQRAVAPARRSGGEC